MMRTASGTISARVTTLMRISLVEIISMLIPASERAGDVGTASGDRRGVLHEQVDVGAGAGRDREDARGGARDIRNSRDRDLVFAEVGSDARDDRFFHGLSLC